MADKIRVGIVGATTRKVGSGWGANAHVPALNGLPDYELFAVCTAHEDSAKDSAAQFGAQHAYSDARELVSNPDVDLVSVVVKVPSHDEVVATAIEAGKSVFCEWPLAANLAEAERMAQSAESAGVFTAVGLQARSDAVIVHARDLVGQGEIGEVLGINLRLTSPNDLERPSFRMWQGDRAAGANPLTIVAGHAIDALRFVFGDFAELQGRVATRIATWTDSDSGEAVSVDAPDMIGFIGALAGGAEVAGQVASVPAAAPAYELTAYGTTGSLVLSGAFISGGPNKLAIGHGGPPEPVEIPAELTAAIDGVPPGPGRNVAAAYARIAAALQAGEAYEPSFADAAKLHRLLDAIAQGSAYSA